MSGKTPEEQVVDLMHETQWTIAGWCMHFLEEEKAALDAHEVGDSLSMWAFSDPDDERGGVSTCIISAGVLAEAKRLAPDMRQWTELRPVNLALSED